jgi:hypothetical protein
MLNVKAVGCITLTECKHPKIRTTWINGTRMIFKVTFGWLRPEQVSNWSNYSSAARWWCFWEEEGRLQTWVQLGPFSALYVFWKCNYIQCLSVNPQMRVLENIIVTQQSKSPISVVPKGSLLYLQDFAIDHDPELNEYSLLPLTQFL